MILLISAEPAPVVPRTFIVYSLYMVCIYIICMNTCSGFCVLRAFSALDEIGMAYGSWITRVITSARLRLDCVFYVATTRARSRSVAIDYNVNDINIESNRDDRERELWSEWRVECARASVVTHILLKIVTSRKNKSVSRSLNAECVYIQTEHSECAAVLLVGLLKI